jgi:hypothetical protein
MKVPTRGLLDAAIRREAKRARDGARAARVAAQTARGVQASSKRARAEARRIRIQSRRLTLDCAALNSGLRCLDSKPLSDEASSVPVDGRAPDLF